MKTMKIKNSLTLVFLLFVIIFMGGFSKTLDITPQKRYIVYLDGEKLGIIANKEEILNIIDTKQEKIKKQFGVDKVYPPDGLKIIPYMTYNEEVVDPQEIYKAIEKKSDFTIKGYVLSITPDEGDIKRINVLKRDIIEEALTNAVEAFIPEQQFVAYINDSQVEIKDTGKTIENIYFKEKITVKESFISVKDLIITNKDDLTKYLLFGTLKKQSEYEVKDGDTVETVAFNNKLSVEELLIANPSLSSANSLLSEGQILNVGLINPQFNVIEESEVIEDVETLFNTVYEDDSNLYASESYVKQEGKKGVTRITEKVLYQNGEILTLVTTNNTNVISTPIDKIVVRGTKKSYEYLYNNYPPAASSTDWGWPTISPYMINSRYGYRWGKLHAGIDITGCGFGSPIFSSTDGIVTSTTTSCDDNGWYGDYCGAGYGNNVVVRTNTGLYVTYGHMKSNITVYAGQTVAKGQVIGYMGNSGSSTGTHLHFQINTNSTVGGASSVDPCAVAFEC